MNITKEKTVAEVVTENVGADHVFSKYNIDFCCGGDVTIDKACKDKGLDFNVLKLKIETIVNKINTDVNVKEMDLVSLLNQTQQVYHNYFNENIPLISQLSAKVAEVHYLNHKEVVEVNILFNKILPDLNEQINTEEKKLFPFIKNHLAQKNGEQFELEQLPKTILNFEKVQKQMADVFKNISKITNNYSLPKDACNTFKLLYNNLQEFEQNLHRFIHFEKNVLFPKVLENL